MNENDPKPHIDDLLFKSLGHNVFHVHAANNGGMVIKSINCILT
jgi:hypothetical protein